MASRKQTPNVLDFYKLLSAKLLAEADMVTSWLGDAHWGEVGRSREAALRNMIVTYLPKGLACGTGFVRGPDGDMSRQCDLVVYEDDMLPPLYAEGDFVIVRADVVRLVIEVKSTLTKPDFVRAVRNISQAKRLDDRIAGLIFALAFPKASSPPLARWLKDVERSGVPADDTDDASPLAVAPKHLPDMVHVASGYQLLIGLTTAARADISALVFEPKDGEGTFYLWDWLLQQCRVDPTRQDRPVPLLRDYLGLESPGHKPAGTYR
jgi:hypothetical protein